MTLAHAILKIFCSQASNVFQCKNLKKKNRRQRVLTLQRQIRRTRNKIRVLLIFILITHTFEILFLTVLDRVRVTDAQTDRRTGPNKHAPQLLRIVLLCLHLFTVNRKQLVIAHNIDGDSSDKIIALLGQ